MNLIKKLSSTRLCQKEEKVNMEKTKLMCFGNSHYYLQIGKVQLQMKLLVSRFIQQMLVEREKVKGDTQQFLLI